MIKLLKDLASLLETAGYHEEADYLHLEADGARSWEDRIRGGCDPNAGREYAEYLREFADIFEAATAGNLAKVAEAIRKEKESYNA